MVIQFTTGADYWKNSNIRRKDVRHISNIAFIIYVYPDMLLRELEKIDCRLTDQILPNFFAL